MNIPDNLETLIFRIGKLAFGVNVEEIIQVLESAEIQQVPDMPDFVQGVIWFRDRYVSVINLPRMYQLHESNPLSVLNDHVGSVVVVKAELGSLGVQIGQIDRIEKLPIQKIEPLPKMIRAVIRLNSIWGMGIVNEEDDQADDSGDIINLVHLHQLLAEEQISSIRHFEEALNSTEDILS